MSSNGKGKNMTRRRKKIVRISEKAITVFTIAFGEFLLAFAILKMLDAE